MTRARRPSISDRIRELAAAGHARADIARMVDRSYQQVRQVLVADEARARRTSSARPAVTQTSPGVHEPPAAAYRALPEPRPARLQVDAMGRVQLPGDWGIPAGAVFIARNFNGSLVLMDVSQASEAARIAGMSYGSDALIAERRLEAMREFDD